MHCIAASKSMQRFKDELVCTLIIRLIYQQSKCIRLFSNITSLNISAEVSSSVPSSLLEQTDNKPALIIYPARQTQGLSQQRLKFCFISHSFFINSHSNCISCWEKHPIVQHQQNAPIFFVFLYDIVDLTRTCFKRKATKNTALVFN